MNRKQILSLVLAVVLLAAIVFLPDFGATAPEATDPTIQTQPTQSEPELDPDGTYDTKDEVALYIHLYGKLPSNYMTKSEARKQGWSSGALHQVIPGMCIGGDTFYNRDGQLPQKT